MPLSLVLSHHLLQTEPTIGTKIAKHMEAILTLLPSRSIVQMEHQWVKPGRTLKSWTDFEDKSKMGNPNAGSNAVDAVDSFNTNKTRRASWSSNALYAFSFNTSKAQYATRVSIATYTVPFNVSQGHKSDTPCACWSISGASRIERELPTQGTGSFLCDGGKLIYFTSILATAKDIRWGHRLQHTTVMNQSPRSVGQIKWQGFFEISLIDLCVKKQNYDMYDVELEACHDKETSSDVRSATLNLCLMTCLQQVTVITSCEALTFSSTSYPQLLWKAT